MKKVVIVPFILFSVLLTSCGNNGESAENTNSTEKKKDLSEENIDSSVKSFDSTLAKAQFHIEKSGDEDNPKSVIFVLMDNEKIKIKEISGTAEIFPTIDFQKYQIPKNAVGGCGAWWAGQGNYFYIVPTEKGFDINEGWQDEEVSQEEGYHWKKIKTL